MQITSSAFKNNQSIPIKFTCQGENVNPPLEFHNVPDNTKSLVLTIEDPDAPAKPWVHWLVFNIPPTIVSILENSIPEGATEGIANGGTHGYEGPCPPNDVHRYLFNLYAVDKKLKIPNTSDRIKVIKEIENHIIEKSQLIGLYKKE